MATKNADGLPDENDILTDEAKNGAELSGEVEVTSETGDDVEVEIVDDTPPEDRNHTASEEDVEPTDEEVNEYSQKVKKRIAKMRYGIHEERRAKEAAERERDEAVAIAQRILAEKKSLEERSQLGETAYVAQAKERVELAIRQAKREYKDAYENGDGEKLADIQEKLAQLAVEKQQIATWERNRSTEKPAADDKTTLQEDKPVVKSEKSSKPQEVVPDEDAKNWIAKNTWFNKNKVMTAVALAVHDELLESGVDPVSDSSEYYGTLDKRMRERFPEHDWGGPKKKKTFTTVAPVGRTSSAARKVVLTQTQIALAKKLGLSPEEYAREVIKLEN